jgi:RecA-family ATPase
MQLFAAHVALGKQLGDRQIDQGRVLMFAGENPDDVRARWIALSEQMQFDDKMIAVHFIPGRFKITQLIERIRKEVHALGGVSLLIIDTSAAYFEGDDENNNVQLGAHASRMRHLGIPGDPCILINCHPTKNATDENLLPRGGRRLPCRDRREPDRDQGRLDRRGALARQVPRAGLRADQLHPEDRN